LEPTISSGRLKSSLPWILHRHSIDSSCARVEAVSF